MEEHRSIISVMEITRENLHKFVEHYSDLGMMDTTGTTRILESGNPDSWDVLVRRTLAHES
jgi:hypothetical protein